MSIGNYYNDTLASKRANQNIKTKKVKRIEENYPRLDRHYVDAECRNNGAEIVGSVICEPYKIEKWLTISLFG